MSNLRLLVPLIAVLLSKFNSVASCSEIKQVSTGGAHSCVLTTSEAICFGSNQYGQGTRVSGFKNAKQMVTGWDHNCVLDEDGVWCWGSHHVGQLVPADLRNVTHMSAGQDVTCVVDDGEMRCWGNLGHPALKGVPSGIREISQVAI
ncbi:MAG: RCC1 domain-containing protein, partial [Bdellovibrionota bacterium]